MSLLKIQKLVGHGGTYVYPATRELRQENRLNRVVGVAVSRSHHCTPAWLQSETQLKKKKIIQEAEAGELLEPERQRMQ